MSIGRRLAAAVLVTTIGSTLALAAGPSFWTVATTADLLQGTSDGVYVSLSGVVTPGPALTSRLGSTPAQVWSLARAQDGTLWAGTGSDGRLLRLRPGETTDQIAFDAPEANIFAVAVSGSRVYAASSPEGKVYVIEGESEAREFFDPSETYIWALAVDADGRLWVGAGNPAVIYRVSPDGTSQVVHRPPAAHVVSLVADGAGGMLAGTESPGRLYRFNDANRPFVLLDSGLAELRAVSRAADGTIFAAAVAKGDETAAAGETPTVAVTMAATATTGKPAATTTPRRSVIFRIEPDGQWEEIWTTGDVAYDLSAQEDGSVLVATGPGGRLYRISEDLDVSLFTGVDARQITRFAVEGDGAVAAFATANPGRVFAIGGGEASSASYLSSVFDTESVARWGVLQWDATGNVALSTRSGNTERPDDSWSEWTGPYSDPTGTAVTSPAARFVQWRAEFTRTGGGPAPTLSSVTLAYLPRNNRPVVSELTIYPPGVVFQRPFVNDDSAIAGLDPIAIEARRPAGETPPAAATLNRRMFQKGLQTIAWKSEDKDDDQLLHRLQMRREGESTWRDLATDVADTIFVWDTTAVADGRYFLRILASDSPSNAGDRALSGGRESGPIDVDNTPPSVEVTTTGTGAGRRILATARDAQSPIRRLEYSLAGGEWRLVYPMDGLADALSEQYEIPVAADVPAADIMVRVTDQLQNVTTAPAAPR